MGYDCSITKRKGCNYCIRGKDLPLKNVDFVSFNINDDKLAFKSNGNVVQQVEIRYCPICGKELL